MTNWGFSNARCMPSYQNTIAESSNQDPGNTFSLATDQTTRSNTDSRTPSTARSDTDKRPWHFFRSEQKLRRCRLPWNRSRIVGWAFVKGWHFRENYPLDFSWPFGHLVHRRLVEHFVRTSNDLSVLGVPKSVVDLAIWSIAKENAFPGSRFEFSTIILRYEGIRLAS